eukprot:6475066-Amphidinium_carterae.4
MGGLKNRAFTHCPEQRVLSTTTESMASALTLADTMQVGHGLCALDYESNLLIGTSPGRSDSTISGLIYK